MNIKKFFWFFILIFTFVFPFKVLAIEPEYDKKIEGDTNYMVLKGAATKDGGYAVLARKDESLPSGDEEAYDYLHIIKYSKNGVMQWTNRYEVPEPPTDCHYTESYYNSESGRWEDGCGHAPEATYYGFVELDNGNLIVVSNYFRMVISETGTLLATLDMGSDYHKYLLFRCEGEGNGTACIAIGPDEDTAYNFISGEDVRHNKVMGRAFAINDDGSISNAYDIPCVKVVDTSDEADSIGIPLSFFKNENGDYVMQTIEGIIFKIYVFNNKLEKKSEKIFFIRDSSINLLQQVGYIYWITGQFSNTDYFGNYINYAGPFEKSKISHVSFNPEMTNVKKQKVIAEATVAFDLQYFLKYGLSVSDEPIAQLLIKAEIFGVLGFLDGYRDGNYVSTFDFDIDGNILDNNSSSEQEEVIINGKFKRIDYNMNEFDEYLLISAPERKVGGSGTMYSSIIRLKDGSDVVLLNNLSDGTSNGRHIKFGNHYVVMAASENTDDVIFSQTVYNPGDIVKVQLRNRDGYYVDKVIVKDAAGNVIDYDKDSQTFVMPDSDVTVEVQYRAIEQKDTGILLSIIFSLLAIGLIGYSNFKYFKKQKPIGM